MVLLGGDGDLFQVGKPAGVKAKMVVGVWGKCANDVDCLGLIESYSVQASANIGLGEPILGRWTWMPAEMFVSFRLTAPVLQRRLTSVGNGRVSTRRWEVPDIVAQMEHQ